MSKDKKFYYTEAGLGHKEYAIMVRTSELKENGFADYFWVDCSIRHEGSDDDFKKPGHESEYHISEVKPIEYDLEKCDFYIFAKSIYEKIHDRK